MDQAPGGEAVMKVRMKVEGGDKLARKLQMLAEEVAREHMRECALAGAEVIRAEIETRHLVKPGRLPGHPKRGQKADQEPSGCSHRSWQGRLVWAIRRGRPCDRGGWQEGGRCPSSSIYEARIRCKNRRGIRCI